jgi:hypothetical protein
VCETSNITKVYAELSDTRPDYHFGYDSDSSPSNSHPYGSCPKSHHFSLMLSFHLLVCLKLKTSKFFPAKILYSLLFPSRQPHTQPVIGVYFAVLTILVELCRSRRHSCDFLNGLTSSFLGPNICWSTYLSVLTSKLDSTCQAQLEVKEVKLSLCVTKHHAMKTYGGNGGVAPRILDFGTRWRWVVSFTPRPVHLQGKSPWYPLDRRLSGPQSRSGRGGEEKNSQPPSEIEP